LQEQSAFADTWFSAQQYNGTGNQSAAQYQIQFLVWKDESFTLVGLNGMQGFGLGDFSATFFPSRGLLGGFDFLYEGVPFATSRTFADPFWTFEAAGFTEKSGFGFGHFERF
jgi:hypothetical protein